MNEAHLEDFENKQNSTRAPRSEDFGGPSNEKYCQPNIMSANYQIMVFSDFTIVVDQFWFDIKP